MPCKFSTNVFDPSAADRLFPVAQQFGVGILARVPLDEGALSRSISLNTQFEGDEFRSHYFRGDRKRQVVDRTRKLQEDLGGRRLIWPKLQFVSASPILPWRR